MLLLRIILLALFLVFSNTVTHAGSEVPPMSEREFVSNTLNVFDYYFVPNTVKLYGNPAAFQFDKLIEAQTIMEFTNPTPEGVKYRVNTVLIKPSEMKFKMVNVYTYGDAGVIVRVLPETDWDKITPDKIIGQALISILEYCQRNNVHPKLWPIHDLNLFTFGGTDRLGDSYYYHPHLFQVNIDSIDFLVLKVLQKEKQGAKYEVISQSFKPSEQKVKKVATFSYDKDGTLLQSIESNDSWSNFDKGSPIAQITENISEYCRKNKIELKSLALVVPSRKYITTLETSEGGYHKYLNPDSIKVTNDAIVAQFINEYKSPRNGVVHITTTREYKITEMQFRETIYREYDGSGAELKSRVAEMPWRKVIANNEKIEIQAIVDYLAKR